MDIGKKCIDPNLELQIFREIAATTLQGMEVAFSPQSQKHLEVCDKCRECTPIYIANSKAAFAEKKYETVIEEAERGDTGILKRNVRQGLALFKPGLEGQPGILVIVDPEHRTATRVRDDTLTLEEFETL